MESTQKRGKTDMQKRICGVRSLSRMGSYIRGGLDILIGGKEVYIRTDAGTWVDNDSENLWKFF